MGTPDTSGTSNGVLTVTVADSDGQPLKDARVTIFNPSQTRLIGSAFTDAKGSVTHSDLEAAVRVHVGHAFGEYYRSTSVEVAQSGNTSLSVVLAPARPQPTVALLPVWIPPDSLSADRSELTLEVRIVASESAPFPPAGYGDYSRASTPSLALALGNLEDYDARECFIWLDLKRTTPICDPAWRESRYAVSILHFSHDPTGTVPLLAAPTPADSVMLVMDQSQRVSELDADARRSFAARRFIERLISSPLRPSIAVAGIAGVGGDSVPALPQRPLWSPSGAGTTFSTDGAVLRSAVDLLEPLIGGSAPVLDGIAAALTLTAANALPGNRALIAVLGGGDDSDRPEPSWRAALETLRQQRDAAGIQTVMIMGAPESRRAERWELAELTAALRAPAISFGRRLGPDDRSDHSWASGSFAALDLAADLINGRPLPSLSATFRVRASTAGAFSSGDTLRGVLYVESDICPMGCWEFPLEFAVEIP